MSRMKLLGLNIKKYRKERHLTQRDIAVALNCTYEFICRVERGQMYIGLRRLFKLADILEVKMTDLINFD